MVEQYRKITINILLFITVLIGFLFTESLILPQRTIKDEIISYSELFVSTRGKFSANSSNHLMGYIFYTKKGYEFSTQEIFIKEKYVTLKQSYIFENITSVKSSTKDYSGKLMSDLTGACQLFTICLAISSIISLLFLWFDKNLSENGFYNIILMNSFLLILLLYLFAQYN